MIERKAGPHSDNPAEEIRVFHHRLFLVLAALVHNRKDAALAPRKSRRLTTRSSLAPTKYNLSSSSVLFELRSPYGTVFLECPKLLSKHALLSSTVIDNVAIKKLLDISRHWLHIIEVGIDGKIPTSIPVRSWMMAPRRFLLIKEALSTPYWPPGVHKACSRAVDTLWVSLPAFKNEWWESEAIRFWPAVEEWHAASKLARSASTAHTAAGF